MVVCLLSLTDRWFAAYISCDIFVPFWFSFNLLTFFLAFLCGHVISDTSGSLSRLSPFSFLLLISIDTCGSYLIFRPLVFLYSLGFFTSDAGEKIKEIVYELIFFQMPFYWAALCVRLDSTMCELPSQPWN